MARPRADINDAGVCNKCGTQCFSNGRPVNGRRVWKPHKCVPKLSKAQKATHEDLALRVATVLLDSKLDDRWLRFAKFAKDYDMLAEGAATVERKVQIEIVEDSNVLEED